MILASGEGIQIGGKVIIGDKYAKVYSYTDIVGEVCTYRSRHPADVGTYLVECSRSGVWYVEWIDMLPVEYDTNAEAIRLLRKG